VPQGVAVRVRPEAPLFNNALQVQGIIFLILIKLCIAKSFSR